MDGFDVSYNFGDVGTVVSKQVGLVPIHPGLIARFFKPLTPSPIVSCRFLLLLALLNWFIELDYLKYSEAGQPHRQRGSWSQTRAAR